MRNAEKTEELLDNFPGNLAFVQKKEDPLHTVMDINGRNLQDLEASITKTTDNLFIDSVNPAVPRKIYYVEQTVKGTDVFEGTTKIVDTVDDFLSMDITGLDKIMEYPIASGVYPSGILGLSYGFDWDDPALYVTTDNNFIDIISNIAPSGVFPSGILPSGIIPADDHTVIHFDYTIVKQDYDNAGFDEYLTMQVETVPILKDDDLVYFTYTAYGTGDVQVFSGEILDITGDCLFFNHEYYYIKTATYTGGQWYILFHSALPSLPFDTKFLLMGDRKVAYLEHTPIQSIDIIDVMNLRDPNNSASQGIIVSEDDYRLEENKVIFSKVRSDFVAASGTIDEPVLYPSGYQPDTVFGSSYLAEYFYRSLNVPRYITQKTKLHEIGLKGVPIASLKKD